MRVGSLEIASVIDGEVAIPTESYYAGHSNDDWREFAAALCHSTGNPVQTVGSFLIRGIGDRLILVDTGVGNNPTFPFAGGALRSALSALGVHPKDITDVLFTHLHFDHIGWASLYGKPFFENATYRCDQRDWDYFMAPDYEIPDWEHILAKPEFDAPQPRLGPIADRMEFWTGDSALFPGLETIDAAGHTPGTTVLRLADGGDEGMILGDVVHGYMELVEDSWHLEAHSDGDQVPSRWSRDSARSCRTPGFRSSRRTSQACGGAGLKATAVVGPPSGGWPSDPRGQPSRCRHGRDWVRLRDTLAASS